MAHPNAAQGSEWDRLAREKLTKVLGAPQGEVVMRESLAAAGLAGLRSAEDLHRFALAVSSRGGFAGAVGAMLGLMATLRGASGPEPAPAQPRV